MCTTALSNWQGSHGRPDPPGGTFERDVDGRPNGILTELAATDTVLGAKPAPDYDEQVKRLASRNEHFWNGASSRSMTCWRRSSHTAANVPRCGESRPPSPVRAVLRLDRPAGESGTRFDRRRPNRPDEGRRYEALHLTVRIPTGLPGPTIPTPIPQTTACAPWLMRPCVKPWVGSAQPRPGHLPRHGRPGPESHH